MWGLTSDGVFINSTSSTSIIDNIKVNLGLSTDQVYKIVLLDLQKVRYSLCLEIQRFKNSLDSDLDRGKRLMFLFQRDLLPGINAMILESKGQRDFLIDKSKVEPYQKLVAWIFILLLNGGLLFYIYLFSLRQTTIRQEAWFQTFVIWLALEIFIMSTITVCVMHILIPSLVLRDLQSVKRRLMQTLRDYKTSVQNSTTTFGSNNVTRINKEFNVANYFFVSTRLSSLYPSLKESMIISKFKSPWPHQSYQHTRSLSTSYSKRFSTLMKSVSMIMVFLLKSLLTLPHALQDLFASLTTIVLSGNFFYFIVSIYNISPILLVVSILLILLLLHFIYRAYCFKPAVLKSNVEENVLKVSNKPSSLNEEKTDENINTSIPFSSTVSNNRLKTRKQSILEGLDSLKMLNSVQQTNSIQYLNNHEEASDMEGDNKLHPEAKFVESQKNNSNTVMSDNFSISDGDSDDSSLQNKEEREEQENYIATVTTTIATTADDEDSFFVSDVNTYLSGGYFPDTIEVIDEHENFELSDDSS